MRRAPTEAEEKLWAELRSRRLDRIKFRRQVPVGNYIADFVCLDAKLVIEIDGSQHGESDYDRVRDADLERCSLATWRLALDGAEPVSADAMRRFAARFEQHDFDPGALVPVYGDA